MLGFAISVFHLFCEFSPKEKHENRQAANHKAQPWRRLGVIPLCHSLVNKV
ncbi:MAG: hypothetical protein ACI9WT_001494 [Flavobacterium sp.]|jgi:hypothetical protein